MGVSLLAATHCASAVRTDDSPMFRGGSRHTGVYSGDGLSTLHGVKWKFHTGGEVISSPVLSGATLYVGSGDHYLYALDAASGSLKWKFKSGSRVPSTPAVVESVVYFSSYDSYIYALDETNGRLLWKFKTLGERRFSARHLHGFEPAAEVMPDPFDMYLSSPVVADGRVYFGSGDHNVYALDAHDGRPIWAFRTGDVVHASPALAEGVLYIGSWDGVFYALDAATGKLRWRFKSGEDHDIHNQVGFQSSAAVSDGIVYVGCRDAHVYALDANTGAQRWALDTEGSWVVGSPAVRDGKVYMATSDSSLFRELDARTGVVGFTLSFRHWPIFSSPALAGTLAFFGTDEGKLVAVELRDKTVAWEFQTDGSRQHGAALTQADGAPNYERAYVDNFYDSLMVGVGRLRSTGAISSSPLVADGVVYFGSADGSVYALN
jgi:eukaryotic-like serine/threonine-protein kinase